MLARWPDTPQKVLTWLDLPLVTPPLIHIQIGIASFALIPLAILLRAYLAPSPRMAFVTVMIAAMSAANAVFPHLGMFASTGRYAPGLITAAAVTLPAGLWAIWSALRARWICRPTIFLAVATGIALLPLVLFGFWALGELIAEISG